MEAETASSELACGTESHEMKPLYLFGFGFEFWHGFFFSARTIHFVGSIELCSQTLHPSSSQLFLEKDFGIVVGGGGDAVDKQASSLISAAAG